MCICRLWDRGLYLGLGLTIAVFLGGCGEKPDDPGQSRCVQIEEVSAELLRTPVYSPIDSCIYYDDHGADSAYFDEFRRNQTASFWPTTQPGIYRLKLYDDSPAELVAANGVAPEITPDGSTLYFISGEEAPGWWGGSIWKKELPDGEAHRIKDGTFIRVCWYSPDTLLVDTGISGGFKPFFLDMSTDSLHMLDLHMQNPDVGPGHRIASGGIRVYYFGDTNVTETRVTDSGIDPRWSPDGKEIVYKHDPDGGGSEIRITDLDGDKRVIAIGGGPYNLTIGSVYDPDFTSDGQYVIYIKNTTPLDYRSDCKYEALVSDGQIWIMLAKDGSGKRQVSTWSRIRPKN